MKKVLALVLAVMMLATLAFALPVHDNGGNAATDSEATYDPIRPGTKLYFTPAELGHPYEKDIKDDNGNVTGTEFVPENNKVTVTFGKGAELVAKQGWVRVGDTKAADSWQYQIVLKDNDAAVCTGKDLDFSITKVTFKATSEKIVEHKFEKENKYERDYGWEAQNLDLKPTTDPTLINGFDEEFKLNIIYTMTATTDNEGKAVNTNHWFMGKEEYLGAEDARNAANAAYPEASFMLKAGQKVLRKNFNFDPTANDWSTKHGYTSNLVQVVNDTNLVGVATVPHWDKAYHVYAVANDGTLNKVAVTVDDGVATFNVPAYRAVVVTDYAMKDVGNAIGGAAAGETTDNPETGANDVIGVAAALAVVALVSGAAISLKK